jgi:hypothetical protein
MPCLLVLFAFITPRLVLILVAIFSDYLHRAYQTAIWPILGFFFMPLTTLTYAWAINSHGSLEGIHFAAVLLAALFDLGALGGGGHKARRRRR